MISLFDAAIPRRSKSDSEFWRLPYPGVVSACLEETVYGSLPIGMLRASIMRRGKGRYYDFMERGLSNNLPDEYTSLRRWGFGDNMMEAGYNLS